MNKTYFRIHSYTVISTTSSVIYFGGYEDDRSDRVVQYQHMKWTELGNLASQRSGHSSIRMDNKIYIFGGNDET